MAKKTPKKTGKKSAGKKTKATARKKTGGKSSSAKRGKKKAARSKVAGKKAKRSKKSSRPRKASQSRKSTRRATSGARKKASRGSGRKRGSRGKAFYEHFRQKLLDQRAQITRRLDELREELSGIEETPRELEEWAQEEKDRDILIRLEERETEELRRIQAALSLIDAREYGTCQVCGRVIPRTRLEELPTAFRCVNCTP